MKKELYEKIIRLKQEVDHFCEETATDQERLVIYPKKYELAKAYFQMGQFLETQKPLESTYCYWKAYKLTVYEPVRRRLFLQSNPPLPEMGGTDEEKIPSLLTNTSEHIKTFLLGLQHWMGISCQQNYQKAYHQLMKIENYLSEACYMIGIMHRLGLFVEKNPEKAIIYFSKSCELNPHFSFPKLSLANIQMDAVSQRDGLEEDKQVHAMLCHISNKMLEKAATEGNASAQSYLGVVFYNGYNGIEKNLIVAVRWLRMGAYQGDAPCQNLFGWMYQNGEGNLPIDRMEAFHWYYLAAQSGNPTSIGNLIDLYQNTPYLPITKDEIHLLIENAKHNHILNHEDYEVLHRQYLELMKHFNDQYQIYRSFDPQNPQLSIDELIKRIPYDILIDFIYEDASLDKSFKQNLLKNLLQKHQRKSTELLIILEAIRRFPFDPEFLIILLKTWGKSGQQLFREQVIKNNQMELFSSTEYGIIREAWVSNDPKENTEIQYVSFISAVLAPKHPCSVGSTLCFLEQLKKIHEDPAGLLNYEMLTINLLQEAWSNIPIPDQSECLRSMDLLCAYFSKNGAGILLQMVLIVMDMAPPHHENSTLERLYHLLERFRSPNAFQLYIKNGRRHLLEKNFSELRSVASKSEKCHGFITGPLNEVFTQLFPSVSRPTVSLFWELCHNFEECTSFLKPESIDPLADESVVPQYECH